MEQVLYEKLVKIRQKDLKFIATNKNTNEAKFKFQGQSARSQRWFNLEFDWIEVNFSTCEPDFYKKPFQIHNNTEDKYIYIIFQVPIGNLKGVEKFKFQNDAPMLKYSQKSLNNCCFCSLEPALDII